jgi:hypothetical protein
MSLYEKRSDAERAGQPYEEPGIQDATQRSRGRRASVQVAAITRRPHAAKAKVASRPIPAPAPVMSSVFDMSGSQE